ncbi:hypothetical protein PCANC_14919 [Puccinia coronata f. sp. avenae]|uniref:Uncharacterized protein n=1 Tax=Puccinia coronata f. sp. avenae TaxID=200324 RepID=A0A2N5SA70_9BASI|nr:hypothetical protein PCANC_14919 [Puccinia coronata f. sp. avenae]
MIELHGEDSDSDKEDGAEESDSKHQTTKKASGSESKNHEGNIDELDPAEDESDESSGGSSVDLRLYMVNRGRITQSDDSKSNVPEKEDKTTQSNETKPDLPHRSVDVQDIAVHSTLCKALSGQWCPDNAWS